MSAEIRFPAQRMYWIISLGGAGYADGTTRPDQVTTVGSPLNLVWLGADYAEYLQQCATVGIQPRIADPDDSNLNINQQPRAVSARQIRLWLVQHGISLAAVDAAIDAIQDPVQRSQTQVEWEYAPYVERTHPMLLPLATALGLTEAQVDQAFTEAAVL
jgi:hypothetical protein